MTGLEFQEALLLVAAAIVSVAFQVFVVVLGVVVAWRWLHRPGRFATMIQRRRDQTAFEILDDRYARGEIDAQEYQERREGLLDRSREDG